MAWGPGHSRGKIQSPLNEISFGIQQLENVSGNWQDQVNQ